MNFSSVKSSPMTFIVPLTAAFVLVAGAMVISGASQGDNRSHASFNGTQQCVKECNSNGPLAGFIKNNGACALDCPRLMSGNMSCSKFCNQNINDKPYTANGQSKPAVDVCVVQCKRWVIQNGSTPAPDDTPIPTATPPKPSFNCRKTCAGVNDTYSPVCMEVCGKFNAGTLTCTTGCDHKNATIAHTCQRLFCSGQ